jgi:hypothetical protein
MSRKAALVIAIAGLSFPASQLATAHQGLQHLMGTVQERSAQQLQVRTTEGRIASVGLDAQTRYERQGKTASAGDLRPGARVVIEAEEVGGRLLARLVRIGVATSAASATPAHAGHLEGDRAKQADRRTPAGKSKTAPRAVDHQAHGAGAPAAPGHRGGSEKRPDAPHAAHPPAAGSHPAPSPEQPSAGHMAHQQPATSAAPASEGGTKPEAHAGHEAAAPHAQPEQAQPGHAGHAPAAAPAGAQAGQAHGAHQMASGMPHRDERALFQSDMALMAGMTPRDPMAGMPMPRWQFMTMGIARLQYNHQGGPSGREAFESVNWSMVMLQRDVGRGRLTLMMMNSMEPATFQKAGSPQLFQTGETFEGRAIVDRQHPHDLFMNLSATYRAPFGGKGAYWAQAALRGEPSLGPTAFMHRASAGENPTATLGHHLQDATHITDNVLTAGIGWGRISAETSVFHGAEPDEGRWDLDFGRLDSIAGRVRLELPRGWSAQVSHGFLKKPEALQEGDTRRTTASLHYGAAGDRPLAATLLWGRNREEHGTFDSVLLEGAYQLTPHDQFYARAEHVDKDLHLLETKGFGQHSETGGAQEEPAVGVRALTVGYLRDVPLWSLVRTGLGADVTLYGVPRQLQSTYGESPVSFHVFLRLRWDRGHGSGGGHGMQH